jgi:hypothetical protein
VYKIDVADGPGYLLFTVTGKQDLKTDAEIDTAIGNECARREASAALVDILGMEGRLPVLENHEAARTFRERMPSSVTKIAIVDSADHQNGSTMYELTATNRGANVRFSERVEDARKWLQAGSERTARDATT